MRQRIYHLHAFPAFPQRNAMPKMLCAHLELDAVLQWTIEGIDSLRFSLFT